MYPLPVVFVRVVRFIVIRNVRDGLMMFCSHAALARHRRLPPGGVLGALVRRLAAARCAFDCIAIDAGQSACLQTIILRQWRRTGVGRIAPNIER